MGGRNAHPIELLVSNGKKHLTKSEIESRKKTEIKLGTNKLICPMYVKKDTQAYKKWLEIIKVYKDTEFISSGDTGLLARYCKTFSEYQSLLEHRKKIDDIDSFEYDEHEKAEEVLGEDETNKLFRKINYIISTTGILQMDAAINKKMDMLIKMEDRLFLNPLSKIKNVPKEKKDDKPKNKFAQFGKVG